MGFLSRRRGLRLRVIALVCLVVFAASAFTPSPLAHAPPFRHAFGQQALAGPGGVATDPVGDVWVADTGHDRVDEYSTSGRLLTTFGENLDSPAGIATDATGHVWVADTGHEGGRGGRVVEFSPVGRVLAVFGAPGRGHGQLDQPVALAITPFGDVWVADQGNSRVEEFSVIGRYRTSFAVPTPAGIGLDVHGDVWVSSPAYAHLRRLHLGAAVLRAARWLPAVTSGHHPGRRRGRAAHRPARGVRQPGPAGPGDQRAGPAPVTIFEDRTRVVRVPPTPQRGFIGTPGSGYRAASRRPG